MKFFVFVFVFEISIVLMVTFKFYTFKKIALSKKSAPSFKYLGVDFQENLSWSITKRRFEEKAKSRIPMITKAVLEGLSVKTGEKLWDTMIRPTLEYAAEVWGGGIWKQADQIQHRVGKILLGLSNSTPGAVARGELGWLSLKARRELKQLIYWGKLLLMDDSRLAKVVYIKCKNTTDSMREL